MEHRDTNYLLYEGLDEDEEKLNGVKAQIFFLTGEGRMEKDSGQGQAGRGAAAAEGEGAEEFSGEGPSAVGASGLMDNLKQEDHGTSRSDQENERQTKEPVPRDMEVAECVQPVSVLVRQRCFQYKFNQWQLQELERFFQQNHYISAELRKQLASWIGVTEARVQNWFKGGENNTGEIRSYKCAGVLLFRILWRSPRELPSARSQMLRSFCCR